MSLLNISRDQTLGALVVGTYVNSVRSLKTPRFDARYQFLYILEVVEVIKYFWHYAVNHHSFLKTTILLALIIDTIDTAAADCIVYLASMQHRKLAALILLMFTNIPFVVGTALFAVTTANNPRFHQPSNLHVLAIFWTAASATSDVVIAIALLLTSCRSILSAQDFSSYLPSSFPRFYSVTMRAGVTSKIQSQTSPLPS
ncbi:hypothetical protein DFH08DRAFT_970555 [Mycena albidolilacea]|uniref:Uncharacterized protein n=1 Tax=Mycena albidolilacea TaxID=1033008 RepID=A0AAD6ZFF2_9AGAR|nr:hypothetical protein DFH08DRAFT_970555 [Mycena albidolilacea]